MVTTYILLNSPLSITKTAPNKVKKDNETQVLMNINKRAKNKE
jgi:hypothetical protein